MHDSIPPLQRVLATLLALTLGLVGLAACGDDNDNAGADSIAAVEEVARRLAEASGADFDYVNDHATDNLFDTVFFMNREDCRAIPEECIGEPFPLLGIENTRVDGDRATSTIVAELFGPFQMGLVREGGTWKGDSFQAASGKLPDGATAVPLSLVDFAFGFDRTAIPDNGNFGFRVRNDGRQTHEAVVIQVPEGDLDAALAAVESEEMPPIALKVFVRPGQELDFGFEEPLPPGTYALVCFFPDTDDPEFVPHIKKGMVAEFEVGG